LQSEHILALILFAYSYPLSGHAQTIRMSFLFLCLLIPYFVLARLLHTAWGTAKATNVCALLFTFSSLTWGRIDTDQVTLGPNLVIKDQSIGVASEANQMNGLNGIIGWSLPAHLFRRL
jgi:hypothetical protein